MKSLRYIVVLFLAFVVFVLGTGAGVVHICSAYCKSQVCSSSSYAGTCSHNHIHEGGGCCHNRVEDNSGNRTSLSHHCDCMNVEYSIDYILKLTQDDDAVSFVQIPMDIPEYISYSFQPVVSLVLLSQAPNAPPVLKEGRTLLALHSTLII